MKVKVIGRLMLSSNKVVINCTFTTPPQYHTKDEKEVLDYLDKKAVDYMNNYQMTFPVQTNEDRYVWFEETRDVTCCRGWGAAVYPLIDEDFTEIVDTYQTNHPINRFKSDTYYERNPGCSGPLFMYVYSVNPVSGVAKVLPLTKLKAVNHKDVLLTDIDRRLFNLYGNHEFINTDSYTEISAPIDTAADQFKRKTYYKRKPHVPNHVPKFVYIDDINFDLGVIVFTPINKYKNLLVHNNFKSRTLALKHCTDLVPDNYDEIDLAVAEDNINSHSGITQEQADQISINVRASHHHENKIIVFLNEFNLPAVYNTEKLVVSVQLSSLGATIDDILDIEVARRVYSIRRATDDVWEITLHNKFRV